MTFDVIVIGGGISGLTTAFYLQRGGKKVLLLERENRFGGNIRSFRENGYLFEGGPQTILANNKRVWELVDLLKAPVKKASPSSEKRFIYKGGKLIPIPLKPWEFFKTPLVGLRSKLRLFLEFFEKPIEGDISVADFVRKHFGEEFLDYFVQPFVSGIYAGDAEKLSLKYAFPKLYEMQKRYGSLLKAFFKEKRVAPKGELISFERGLQTLTDLLAEKIENKLKNTPALGIKVKNDLFEVETPKGIFSAKKLVIATPAYEAAKLLSPLYPSAKVFKEIQHPPVAVVSLSFPKIGLEGFGFLVPKREGLNILGAIYVSSLFPDRCPPNEDCLTVFLCGETQKSVCLLEDEGIIATAEEEIKRVFPQIGNFNFRKLTRWNRSIPQYTLGYGRYYKTYEGLRQKYPNLYVVSNFLGGSSLAKCIERATETAEEILKTF